jgi:hypothetical protein
MKACGGAVLLLLVSASVSQASQPPGRATRRALRHATHHVVPQQVVVCDPRSQEPPTIQKIVKQAKAVGGPVRHFRRLGLDLHRTTSLARMVGVNNNDEQAIQNDTLDAHVPVDPAFTTLRPLGFFIDPFEQRPLTIAFSPRSPRGPPDNARHPFTVPGGFVNVEVIDAGCSSRPEV